MTVLTQPLAVCPAKAIVCDIVYLRILWAYSSERVMERLEGFNCTEYQVNYLFYHEGQKWEMLEWIWGLGPLCAPLHFAYDLLLNLKERQDDYTIISFLMLNTQQNFCQDCLFESWEGQAIHLSSATCLNFLSLSAMALKVFKIQKASRANYKQMIMGQR